MAANSWTGIALRRDTVLRGLRVGIIVGSILTVINYGDVLLAGQLGDGAMWKIFLTYCVPYCVSSYASVAAELARSKTESG